MANFTIEGRAKAIGDIQRNFMYEVSIPNIGDILSDYNDEEPMVIRARTAVIPGRTNEPIESVFMGMKQQFPGKETFAHTFEVQYEESEDQFVAKWLYAWKEQIFTVNPDAESAGASQAAAKRDRQATDLFLKMYKYDGSLMQQAIRFYNAWPAAVADVSMDYTANESVKYSVTFEYDFWTLVQVA